MDKIKVYQATNLKEDDTCFTLTRFHKLVKRKIIKVEEKFKDTDIILGEDLLSLIHKSGWFVLEGPFDIKPELNYEVMSYENSYTFEDNTTLPSYCVYTM